MLLNKNTYAWISEVDVSVRKFRCWLTLANILVTILILVITACEYFGDTYQYLRLLTVSDYSSVTFQFLCMIAWTWTLIRLYRNIEHSEKLLPKKRLFILHGSLLTGYLLLFALDQILVCVALNLENKDTYLFLIGIVDILLATYTLLEMMSFFLVAKLMLSITLSDKEKRSKFQRFLFNGFADKNELKAAILANNPDMNQS